MVIWSLRYNLAHLFRFSGRQSRSLFWPYTLLVLGTGMVGWMGFVFVQMIGMVGAASRYGADNPDKVTVTYGPGSVGYAFREPASPLAPDITLWMWTVGGVMAVLVLLLASATVRRLHDGGRTGWWILPPILVVSVMAAIMLYIFRDFRQSDPTADGAAFFGGWMIAMLVNLAYIGSLGVVLVFCVLRGSPGENRYGPPVDMVYPTAR